mgnify:CR=1 FL=1
MRTLIIGASGLIGKALMKELGDNNHQPVALSRNLAKARDILGENTELHYWDGQSSGELAGLISGTDAVINLAGENISAGRWTSRRKSLIIQSRVNTGKILAEALKMSSPRPSVLIQGSAIGIYGTRIDTVTGENGQAGTGFIAELTEAWEQSVKPAEDLVSRMIRIRTGLVLARDGGLMEKMMLPYRFGSGAILGSGRQWMSWIHITDQVRAIRFLLENNRSAGVYNLTAPEAVTMEKFMRTISLLTGKPAWLRIPGWLLKTALGEMAGETVLASQNIYPQRLLNEGFIFNHSSLESALRDLVI